MAFTLIDIDLQLKRGKIYIFVWSQSTPFCSVQTIFDEAPFCSVQAGAIVSSEMIHLPVVLSSPFVAPISKFERVPHKYFTVDPMPSIIS
jgi:hypothetical protein